MGIKSLYEILFLSSFRFLDLWDPERRAAGGSTAIPMLATRYHHQECQRYPTACISNVIPPRTLPTLSHHHAGSAIPQSERYRTSHTVNAIPPPTLPTLPHFPHHQHYPSTCNAGSITPTLPNPQSQDPHCQTNKVNVKQFVYRRSTLIIYRCVETSGSSCWR